MALGSYRVPLGSARHKQPFWEGLSKNLNAKSVIGGAVAFAAFLCVVGRRPAQVVENVFGCAGTVVSLKRLDAHAPSREGPMSAFLDLKPGGWKVTGVAAASKK